MSGLLAALDVAAGALRAFEKGFSVIQNNVTNASTPGYAKQRLYLEALPFDPDMGLLGGVSAERIESARQEYAEQAVRERQSCWARADELAQRVAALEGLFEASAETGLGGAITALFAAFSAWSVAPNDTVARQAVIERARALAGQFQQTARALSTASFQASNRIRATVARINELAGRIKELNGQYRRGLASSGDAGMDAQLHSTLEELAELVDFTALRNEDGSVSILLGGQVPLVVGEHQFQISASESASGMAILDSEGRDVTQMISQGRLSAQLEVRNVTLGELMTGLNRLAAAIADSINAVLAAGLDRNNQPGAPLFAYAAADTAAISLHVTSIQPDQLAAASAAAPGGNANALDLASLADSPVLDGLTFVGYYGVLARQVGNAVEEARQLASLNQQLLLQARQIREEASAVSLEEEAVQLIQFQRSYQAAAKTVQTIDELLDSLLAMLR